MKREFLGFAIGVSFVFNCVPVFSALALVERGHPNGIIVVDPKAADSVQIAAKELQKYFRLATDAEIPILAHPDSTAACTIHLGDSEFARSKGIETEKMPPDGFRIRSADHWLIIAGKDYVGPPLTGAFNPYRWNESYNQTLKLSAFGNAGTLCGVYYFLDHYLGVRWYMPGDLGTVVPKQSMISLPPMDVRKSPAFEYRYPYFCFFSSSDEDALWYRRLGFGAPFPVAVSHSFGTYFIKYRDSHPEYFALIGGQRDFTALSSVGPGNLNLSCPSLLQQAIQDINEYFDRNPNEKIFSLCPNDGLTRISEDPQSQAQIVPNREGGAFSNYIWGFIDKVARGVAVKHPDRYIGCIAYEDYVRAPTNIRSLSPNVIVIICKRRGDYTDPKSRTLTAAIIAEWKSMASHIYCWEYYCDILMNPGWRGYPAFYPRLVQDDLKSLRGVTKGEFIEAESWSVDQYAHPDEIKINYPGLQHPLLYVTARLLWDPDLDLQKLMDEYYRLFYGPAEIDMRAFWGMAEKSWMKKGAAETPPEVFDRNTLSLMLSALEKATAKTEEKSAYRQRIELIEREFKPAAQKSATLERMKGTRITIPCLGENGPVIDGRLEPLWGNVPLRKLIDRDYLPSRPITHLRMGWTTSALYLSVACYEPNMDKLVATARKRDASGDTPIWFGDSVEIFLKPGPKQGARCYQFIVNSVGTLWDGTRDAGGHADSTWNRNARVAVSKEPGRWVVEMAIPWKDIGVNDPKAGVQILGSVMRNRVGGQELRQFSLFPLITGVYADQANLGSLLLSASP